MVHLAFTLDQNYCPTKCNEFTVTQKCDTMWIIVKFRHILSLCISETWRWCSVIREVLLPSRYYRERLFWVTVYGPQQRQCKYLKREILYSMEIWWHDTDWDKHSWSKKFNIKATVYDVHSRVRCRGTFNVRLNVPRVCPNSSFPMYHYCLLQTLYCCNFLYMNIL